MSLEQIKDKNKEIRVVPKIFFQYDHYIEELKNSFQGTDRWNINQAIFPNGTPWIQVLIGKGYEKDLQKNGQTDIAYVPLWISEQFGSMGDILFEVEQVGNALTRKERKRPSLVKKIIGIAPYIELRQDKDSLTPDKKSHKVGEASNAEIIAKGLGNNGFTSLVLLDPHSREALQSFDKMKIEHIDLTMTPIFASKLKKDNLVGPDSAIVSLDKGALQRCLYLCERLHLDPKTNLVVFDKNRPGITGISKLSLIWGNPSGKKLIILEDLFDSGGTAKKGCASLIEMGAQKGMIFMATHGILSYPARDNVQELLDSGLISRLILSDSLRAAAFDLEGINGGLTILKTAKIMATAAKMLASLSKEQLKENKLLKILSLKPEDKEKVWLKFKAQYGSNQ